MCSSAKTIDIFAIEARTGYASRLHQAARAGVLTEAGVKELGELLFAALFDDVLCQDCLSLYEEVRRKASVYIRIELDVNERRLPNAAALPWEFMHVPLNKGYGEVWLSTASALVFSRRPARWSERPTIQLAPGERLRIALAVAAPSRGGLGR